MRKYSRNSSLVRAIAAVVLVTTCVACQPRPTGDEQSAPPSASGPTAGSPSGFPDASNTGVPAGVVLKQVPAQVSSGAGWHWDGRAVVIDADHVTLNGLDITGPVSNQHDYLTVTNTRIRCVGENDWCITLGSNSTISDTEIGGGANGSTYLHAIGVYTGGPNNLIQRVNIHHTIHGMRVDNGTTIRDSYIHDMPMGDPVRDLATGQTNTDDHTDAIMVTGAPTNELAPIVLDHNRIESGNTANFFVQRDVTDTSKRIPNLLIQNNLFLNVHRNGQDSSFGIDIENKGIGGTITITNNTFNKSSWTVGPIQAPASATTTGNTYTDGTPVTARTSS
jgi:hypothetical protein